MKKIINEPDAFVDEFIEGILAAHPSMLKAVTPDRRALARADAPVASRVGIVTGGGSGHLPLFLGYVGQGLATAVAVGNVFSSPSPEQILAATRAAHGGAGVLYLYGNYGGDVMNFDLAGDLASAEGIETATILGTDDVASAPPERAADRRGVAGLVFAYKCAGAAAESGLALSEVAAAARSTVANTRSMGVGLSPTILPAAGKPTFEIGPDEMEIGIGIHGERGVRRGRLETADRIAADLLGKIAEDLSLARGDRVAVLVNGLGATPLEELYVLYRYVKRELDAMGVTVVRPYVGEFATSLEMAGASLSVLRVTDDLGPLLEAPARPVALLPAVTGSELRAVLARALEILAASEDEIRDLDAAVGDGDLGITVSRGAVAARKAMEALPAESTPADIFRALAAAIASANPSSFAALAAGGLLAAARSAEGKPALSGSDFAALAREAAAAVAKRGKSEIGDKTVLDALVPSVAALEADASDDHLAAMIRAARRGIEETTPNVSRRGRASWLGERSQGHPDPGAVVYLRLLEAIHRARTGVGNAG